MKKTTLLELVSLFANNDTNLIPVLDKDLNYIGYYELGDILDVFADSPFLHLNNETLIVETKKSDHSMSQISQIVESNKGKLLGLYVSYEGQETIHVTLKIASDDLIDNIIQTFRRYNYTVITQHKDDSYIEELNDRARYLKKYLDM